MSLERHRLDALLTTSSLPIVLPAITLCGLAVLAEDGHSPFVDMGYEGPSGKYVPFYKVRTMKPNAQCEELELVRRSGGTLSDIRNGGIVLLVCMSLWAETSSPLQTD